MKILSWNIWGLNSLGKQHYLKEKLKKERPDIMFLQETKIIASRFDTILKNFTPHYEVMVIDVRGTAGGIAIIWNPSAFTADAWFGFHYSLTGTFRMVGSDVIFLVTVVYGPHSPVEKSQFLDTIRELRLNHQENNWIIDGDFNLILNLNEKKGGIRREDQEMELFRDLLADLHLVDIHTVNGIYTWNNCRGEAHQVASHLNRFLVSEDLYNLDLHFEASILLSLGYEHWPISLSMDIKDMPQHRPFRFEKFWLQDPSFVERVKHWWQSAQI